MALLIVALFYKYPSYYKPIGCWALLTAVMIDAALIASWFAFTGIQVLRAITN